MSEPHIFISYSHTDSEKEWVREFVEALQRQGVSVWFDEAELPPGTVLTDAIENALRKSDTLISVVSPEGIKRSAWFYFELGAALGTHMRIVPIVPEDLDPALLPHPLRIRKYLPRKSPQQTAKAFASATAEFIASSTPPVLS
jgi:hypothetical protein